MDVHGDVVGDNVEGDVKSIEWYRLTILLRWQAGQIISMRV